ncbi:MAG: addiction module antidote protein [Geminicoccaceae bacterium]
MAFETKPFDAADYLETPEDIALDLEEVFKDGDQQLIVEAIGDAARSRGMTEISKTTGLGRESLYKALGPTGNPEFGTTLRVLKALGLRLAVEQQELEST